MANNRIAIKCAVCGDELVMAKTMGGEYYASPVFTVERLNKFLKDHAFCDEGPNGISGGEGEFRLEYEFPEEFYGG